MFDKHWFSKHQRTLIKALNMPLVGSAVRRAMWITDYKNPVVCITPNAVHVRLPDGTYGATLYSNKQYQEAILCNGRWLWEALHWWDMQFANRLVPALNVGFDYWYQPSDTDGVDTYLNSAAATTNYETSTIIQTGEWNGGSATGRTLIKFEMSSIPFNAAVTAATLSLWINADFSNNARDVKLYRTLRAWVESQATWNVWSTGNNWTTAGCGDTTDDYDSTVWATKNLTATEAVGTEEQFVFNATGLTELKKFIDGTYTNNGWLLKADTETDDQYNFDSSSSATVTERPQLFISYTHPSEGLDDDFTVALLHFPGQDSSYYFQDESGKTWTANGNAQIDTAQSVFGGASGLFDGTGDYLSAADSDDWQLDGGSDSNAWTIDFRVRFNGDPGTAIVGFVQQRVDANNHWYVLLNNNNLQVLVRSGGSIIINIQNAWNPATATWYHVAVVKNGTTGYLMFVDGSQIGTTQTDTSTIPNLAASINVARMVDTSSVEQALNGWLDEFRISKGIARWTANFTPPTVPYGPASVGGAIFFT